MHMQEKPLKINPQLSAQSEIDAAAAAALRAELEIELQNKKQCSYQTYECTQLTLDGYKYCLKHILQDKNSPFKQCSFIYTNNGKRCQLPAPKGDKKDYGYCNEHALKATLARNKQNSKFPPPNTAEVLLQSLSHYVKKPRNRTASSSSTQHSDDGGRFTPDDAGELKVTKSLDPFTELDAANIYNKQCNDVLDLCSESESDVEASTFASVWHDAQGDSSDNESIDSDQEDVLKHANVYTAEEITLVTRDKLIRLQSLYIEQYRHLQHMLKEKRRKYLHSLKREKETCCNIFNQVRDNPKEQRLYRKLKAFNNYHKAYGVDAILNKRLHDLRAKITDGVAPKGHSFSKCLFTEGGVKCGERTLPLARHCRKHILEDPAQVLFKSCGKVNGDIECNTPVEAIFDDSTCHLHMDIPPLRSYSQPRKDSESDLDDSAEAAASHFPLHFTENVKTELIDYNLPSEIPKMETLPSMLFEETSNMVNNSPLQTDMLFNNTTDSATQSDVEMKMDIEEPIISEQPTASDLKEDQVPKETESNIQIESTNIQADSTNIDNIKNDLMGNIYESNECASLNECSDILKSAEQIVGDSGQDNSNLLEVNSVQDNNNPIEVNSVQDNNNPIEMNSVQDNNNPIEVNTVMEPPQCEEVKENSKQEVSVEK